MDSTLKIRKFFATEVSLLGGRYSILQGLFVTLFYVLSAVIPVALFNNSDGFLYFILAFWIGTRMRALGNIVHECAHSSFFCNSTSNTWLGNALAFLDMRSFSEYRQQHRRHHAHLGDKDRDPDYLSFRPKHVLCYLKNLLPRPWFRQDTPFLNCARTLYAICFFIAAVNPVFRNFVLIPYFSSYLFCRILSDFADHGGLSRHPDVMMRSRNHIFPSVILNTIFFPRNDAYHLIHHIFPRLPARYFKRAHALLATHLQRAKGDLKSVEVSVL